MQNIRKTVYLSLLSCEKNGRYSNLEADSVLKTDKVDEKDRGFYTALFYGVIERKITLDYQIAKLCEKPLNTLQQSVVILLRIGLYQLLYMNSVPDHAAINETVILAKETVNSGAVGFINGVLRSATRKLKDEKGTVTLITPDRTRDICGYLSITYGYPRYLSKIWVNAYGEENAEKIMQAMNRPPRLSIRVNTLKISREKYLYLLDEAGYNALPSEITEDGITVSGGNVSSLPGYDVGYFFIQDDASAMAIRAFDAKEGETVIDTCACPGGKSFLTSIYMKNKGRIISSDIHENKLSLIESGKNRLGISIIETRCADASVFDSSLEEAADKVLCDVPCSGFGTIAKKPDLRHKTKDSIAELPKLQLSILQASARYCKRGGYLMYSTCTLYPAENEENVRTFLALSPDFKLVNMVTNFPYESLSDGFFYAIFKRS